ncbi:MAG: hypothetical protein ACR2OJ_16205 [Hyphomicrobiales bacterium]
MSLKFQSDATLAKRLGNRILTGMVASAVLALPFAVAGLHEVKAQSLSDLLLPPIDPGNEGPLELDQTKCIVTKKMVNKWIRTTDLAKKLDETYEAVLTQLPNQDVNYFGHKKTSEEKKKQTKQRALTLLNSQRESLRTMARGIIVNRIEACDICTDVNNLGKLSRIAETSSRDINKFVHRFIDNTKKTSTGENVTKVFVYRPRDLSLAQVRDKTVIRMADWALLLRSAQEYSRPPLVGANSQQQNNAKRKSCRTYLQTALAGLGTKDAKKDSEIGRRCDETFLSDSLEQAKKAISARLHTIANAGATKNSKPASSLGGALDCQRAGNFDFARYAP